MVLIGNCESEFIGAILIIVDNIKLETMKHPKGSLYEHDRSQINGITKAYVELSKKILGSIAAEQIIHYLYFEFEKPLSEYLGFRMSTRLPHEYLIIQP